MLPRLWLPMGLVLHLLAGWAESSAAAAVAAAPQPVQVRQVLLLGSKRFVLPQVLLPNSTAARAINRCLVQELLQAMEQPAPASIPPMQALRLAQKICCIDEETGQRRSAQGLTGFGYRVLHNDGRLLSFEFEIEHTGAYAWSTTQHAVFDVHTGQRLRLFDVVAEAPAHLRRQLRWAINRRLTETLKEVWEENHDSADIQDLAERFNWNLRTRRVDFADASKPILEDFSVSAHGITVFYQPWLPPGWWPHSPESGYFFPFTTIQGKPRWNYLWYKG